MEKITKDLDPAHNSDHQVEITQGPQHTARPVAIRHISAPPYQSPLHHRERRYTPRRNPVKVTHDAHSEYGNSQDDGTAEHRINQYVIKQEIGRGSFGSVHMAVDQFGREFAVKEFSKARLRKRAQSHMLRRPPNRVRSNDPHGRAFNSPLARHAKSPSPGSINSFDLIKEEIAIMKKLNHPNVVSLVEVLDDPSEDLLYMVMEMCKKGVVMKVGLDEKSEPYPMERCRLWFRDLVLGIEYLHAQGIVHRDIKPDNCLVTNDDVLKIVDFGVSEMFNKDSQMTTKKSAGSPAFLPPELCVAGHGEVSGRAVDIWSMGVTLYCLAFGCIPFQKEGMLDLFESIKTDKAVIPDDCDPQLRDLLLKVLEKDPTKRIEMDEIREHPWVTLNGEDKLLSKEDNIVNLIEPPTQEEVNRAITAPMRRMMKAATKFKRLLARKRPEFLEGMFGTTGIVRPPENMGSDSDNEGPDSHLSRMQTDNLANRKPIEGNLTAEGIVRDIKVSGDLKTNQSTDKIDIKRRNPIVLKGQWGSIQLGAKPHMPIHAEPQKDPQIDDAGSSTTRDGSAKPHLSSVDSKSLPPSVESPSGLQSGVASPVSEPGKGHAHNPLEDTLFLRIGASADDVPHETSDLPVVSESPSAAETDVYERAYEEEIQKILASRKQQGRKPTLYLTKRVEAVPHLRDHEDITDFHRAQKKPVLGFATLAEIAKSAVSKSRADDKGKSSENEPEKTSQDEGHVKLET